MKIKAGDYVMYNGYQNVKYYVSMVSDVGPEPIVELRKLARKDTVISAKTRIRPMKYCKKIPPPTDPVTQLKNYIYLLYNPDSDEYKIGRTHDFKMRLRSYKQTYKNIQTVFCVIGVRSIENQFMALFKKKICRPREWFRFDSEDMIQVHEFFARFA